MGRAPGNQKHKGKRTKIGNNFYYKGRYYIAFYREVDDDEEFYLGFNNVVEICKYLKWEITTTNINKIHQLLYTMLYKKDECYTKLIDGVKLKVYLVDMIDEIKENERREKDMKRFVKINSTIAIEVYPDLSAIDTTNEHAPMADRLSAKPNWVIPVLIRTGIHYYPSQIKTWSAVKALQEKNVLSISEEVDDIPDVEKEICEALLKKMERVASRKTETKTQSNATKQTASKQTVADKPVAQENPAQ